MNWKETLPYVGAIIALFATMVGTLCWAVKKLVNKFSTDMCKTQVGMDDLMKRTLTLVENHLAHSTEAQVKTALGLEQLTGHIGRQTDAMTRLVTRIDKTLNGRLKHGKK